jgi:hypothetical protein
MILIGKKVVKIFRQRGHDVVAASPSSLRRAADAGH